MTLMRGAPLRVTERPDMAAVFTATDWHRGGWIRPAGMGRLGLAMDMLLAGLVTRLAMVGPPAATGQPDARTARARFDRSILIHLDAAYNFARYLSRDADAAEDIVQEACLRAWRGFEGYLGGDARAWLFSIVRNCHQDWIARRRRHGWIEQLGGGDGDQDDAIAEIASAEADPEERLLMDEETRRVRAVLNALPRPLREMLVLREIEGLSYREIAQVAAVPIGTVMSRLARAREQFLKAWQTERTADRPADAASPGPRR